VHACVTDVTIAATRFFCFLLLHTILPKANDEVAQISPMFTNTQRAVSCVTCHVILLSQWLQNCKLSHNSRRVRTHRRHNSTRQDKFSTCSVSKFSSAIVVSCEFNTHRRRRRNSTRQLSCVGVSASAMCIGFNSNSSRLFCCAHILYAAKRNLSKVFFAIF